jgi:hypothetical protein
LTNLLYSTQVSIYHDHNHDLLPKANSKQHKKQQQDRRSTLPTRNNTIATTRQQTNGNMSTTTKCTPLVKDACPTHLTLATLQRELNFYALKQKTHLVGGPHGYLALLLSPAAYLAISNIAFIKPVHPGPNPIHLLGATAPQIMESNRAYASALVQYTAYHTVEQQLKTMILEAVPATFVQLLEDQQFGYALVSTFTILNHLDTTYGVVTTQDLANNLDDMDKQWSPKPPIKDLWTQIPKARNYAATRNNAIFSSQPPRTYKAQVSSFRPLSTGEPRQWRSKPIKTS